MLVSIQFFFCAYLLLSLCLFARVSCMLFMCALVCLLLRQQNYGNYYGNHYGNYYGNCYGNYLQVNLQESENHSKRDCLSLWHNGRWGCIPYQKAKVSRQDNPHRRKPEWWRMESKLKKSIADDTRNPGSCTRAEVGMISLCCDCEFAGTPYSAPFSLFFNFST